VSDRETEARLKGKKRRQSCDMGDASLAVEFQAVKCEARRTETAPEALTSGEYTVSGDGTITWIHRVEVPGEDLHLTTVLTPKAWGDESVTFWLKSSVMRVPSGTAVRWQPTESSPTHVHGQQQR
jgi:hypothetical protein